MFNAKFMFAIINPIYIKTLRHIFLEIIFFKAILEFKQAIFTINKSLKAQQNKKLVSSPTQNKTKNIQKSNYTLIENHKF